MAGGVADVALVLASWWAVGVLAGNQPLAIVHPALLGAATIALVAAFRVGRLSWEDDSDEARSTAMGCAVATLLAGGARFGVVAATLGGTLAFGALCARRQATAWRLEREHLSGRSLEPVMLVGDGLEALEVLELLTDRPELGYDLRGIVGDIDGPVAASGRTTWLGPLELAAAAALEARATSAIVLTDALPRGALGPMVGELCAANVRVCLRPALPGLDRRRLSSVRLGHTSVLALDLRPPVRVATTAKRCLDVALASVLLLLSLPVLLTAAALIHVADGGPALFRQRRIGRGGVPFTLLKLRTMVPHAEQLLDGLRSENDRRDGPLFKVEDDPRVTRIGQMLRRTSIDELPQLLNVLTGTMSLIGPRPALPDEVMAFDAELLERHRVRPGITGLWQVECRDAASFCHYRGLDLYYVRNWSLGLDVWILAATARIVLVRLLAFAGRAPARVAEAATPELPSLPEPSMADVA